MSDTRKDKRAQVPLKVRFKSATLDEFIEQYAKDISRGGIFIKSKQPMPVGTLLKFEIQLKDESPLIQGVGRVVWKREAGDGASPSGMGIKFIRMEPEHRALVEKIISQRGEAPGQFESGGTEGEEAPAPASGGSFFPSTTPQSELPKPEDRTQVRHASEFLASALAEAGADESAKEAEKKAEEARRRAEQLEKERAATTAREAEKARAEAEAEEKKRREEEEAAARAEAAARRAAEAQKERDEEARRAADARRKKEADKAAAAAAAPVAEKPARPRVAPVADISTDRPPPVEEPRSYTIPAVIAIVAVLGVGAVVWSQMGAGSATTEPEQRTDQAANPPEEPAPGDEGAAAEGEMPPGGEAGAIAAAPTEGTTEAGTEAVPTEVAPTEAAPSGAPAEAAPVEAAVEPAPAAPAAATVAVRVETTPPGATLLLNGTEVGTSPRSIELPQGQPSTVVARLAGYREGSQAITPGPHPRPVRIALAPTPYVIEVTTNVGGVRVRAAGRTAVTAAGTPSRITVPRPQGPTQVSGSRAGYADGTRTVLVPDFQQRGEEMVASVSLELAERAPAASRPPGQAAAAPTTEGGGAQGSAEPAPEAGGGGESGGGGAAGSGAAEERPEPAPQPAPEPAPEAGGGSGGSAGGGSGEAERPAPPPEVEF